MPIANTNHTIKSQILLDKLNALREESEINDEVELEHVITSGNMSINEAECLLEELDGVKSRILAERGLTRETAAMISTVASESLISKSVRSTLTEYPSRPDLVGNTVVACEALSSKLKIGLLVAIIGIILKILGWLLGRSGKSDKYETGQMGDRISELVDSTDGASKKIIDTFKCDLAKLTLFRIKDELEKEGKLTTNTFGTLVGNMAQIDEILDDFLLAKGKRLKTVGVLDGLREENIDVLYNIYKVYQDDGEAFTTAIIDKSQNLYRVIAKEIIKTNVGVSTLPTSKDDEHSEVGVALKDFYGGTNGHGQAEYLYTNKADSLFRLMRSRVFTDDAFRYFNSKLYESNLRELATRLGMISSSLNTFLMIYRRDKDKPFWESGLFDGKITMDVIDRVRHLNFKEYAPVINPEDDMFHGGVPGDRLNKSKYKEHHGWEYLRHSPMNYASMQLIWDGIDPFTLGAITNDPHPGMGTPMAKIVGPADNLTPASFLGGRIINGFWTINESYKSTVADDFDDTHELINIDAEVLFAGQDTPTKYEDILDATVKQKSFMVLAKPASLLGSDKAALVDKLDNAWCFRLLSFLSNYRLCVDKRPREHLANFDPQTMSNMHKQLQRQSSDLRKQLLEIEKLTPKGKGSAWSFGSSLSFSDPKLHVVHETIWTNIIYLFGVVRGVRDVHTDPIAWRDDSARDIGNRGYDTWNYLKCFLKYCENTAKVAATAKSMANAVNRSPLTKRYD